MKRISPSWRLWRTPTFRLALIYMGLFSLSVLALLGFIYFSTAGITTAQTDDTINAEITGLGEQYRRRGLAGLRDIVAERSRNQRQSLYLLIGPGAHPLAGNLDSWPEVETAPGGWLEFPYQRPTGATTESHLARARHLVLGGGFQLLVGREVEERRTIEALIKNTLLWTLLITLGLGLAGGILISRDMIGRLEAINRASREIMAGEWHRRIPLDGGGGEFDRLAENLNAMLGEIEKLVGGMRDVTENIAQDLRGPLNRMRTRLEVTLMAGGSTADYREALEKTIAEAEGLIGTFNGLLAIALAEQGSLEREMTELDLGRVMEEVGELYEPLAQEKSITLTLEGETGAVIVGDANLISQSLANLLDNAVKYVPAGGSVRLTLARQGDAYALGVADDGPGIPEADRGRVLERFQRLEPSRGRPGNGLGLALVRAVAGLHKAELILTDNNPGLIVTLRFPIP